MKESVTENEDRITEETVIVNDHRVMNNDDEAVECSTDISKPVVTMQTSAIAVPGPMICYVTFLSRSFPICCNKF